MKIIDAVKNRLWSKPKISIGVTRRESIQGVSNNWPKALHQLRSEGYQKFALCLFVDEASVWSAAWLTVIPRWVPIDADVELWLLNVSFQQLQGLPESLQHPMILEGRVCIRANPIKSPKLVGGNPGDFTPRLYGEVI